MTQMIPILIGMPLIGFWLWMLVDMTNHPYLSRKAKNNWLMAFVFLNFFGALWYYLVEFRPRHV